MARFLYLLLFVVAFVGHTHVRAATILSDRTQLLLINNKITTAKLLTVQCTEVDVGVPYHFIIQGTNGTTANVSIDCSAPVVTYQDDIVYRIPADGVPVLREGCFTRDASRYDPGYNIDPFFNRFNYSKANTNPGGRALQSIFGDIAGAIGGSLACAVGLGNFVGGCGNSGIDPHALDAVNKAISNLNSSFFSFLSGYNTQIDETADKFTNIDQTLTQITTFGDQSIQRANYLQSQLDLQHQDFSLSTAAITNTLNGVITQNQLSAASVASIQTEITRIIGTGDTTYRTLFGLIQNVTNQLQASMASMQTTFGNARQTDDTRIRQLSQMASSLAGNMRELVLQTALKRMVVRQLQDAITNVTLGAQYVPFLSDYGLEPASALGPYAHVLVDKVSLLQTTDVLGSPVASQIDISLWCDTMFVTGNIGGWVTNRDIISFIGPAGCNPSVPANCSCFVDVARTTCPINVSMVTNSKWKNAVSLNASQICTSAATVGSTTEMYNGTQFLNYLTTSCNSQPTYSNTDVRIYSRALHGVVRVPYVSAKCNATDYLNVFDDPTPNMVNMLFEDFVQSYSAVITAIDTYMDIIDGTMPTHTTEQWEPFVRRQGQAASCLRSQFMAFSTATLPVHVLTNPRQTQVIKISYNNVSFIDSSMTVVVPLTFQAAPSYTVVGDVVSPSVVYDIPETILSLAPKGRDGQVTYTLCPSTALSGSGGCNLTSWETTWGDEYDHFQGENVAAFYKRGYNPTTQLCTGQAKAQFGTWCSNVLGNGFVSGGHGQVAIEPRTFSAIVSFTLPLTGDIIEAEFSACPAISTDATSGQGVTVTLTNAQSQTITIAIVETGNCPRTFNRVPIGGGSVLRHYIPQCNDISTSYPQTNLSVFRYNDDGSLAECVAAQDVNVTTDRANVIGVLGLPDTRYVNSQSILSVDPVALAAAKLAFQFQSLAADIAISNVQALTAMGFPIPTLTLDIYADLINRSNIMSSVVASLSDSARNVSRINLTELQSPYDAQLAQQHALADAKLNATLATLATIKLLNFEGENLTAVLINTNALMHNLTDRLENAVSQFTSALSQILLTLADAINTGNSDNLFTLFSAIATGVSNIIVAGADDATKFVDTVVTAGAGLIDSTLGFLGGAISSIIKIIVIVALVAVGVGAAYLGYRYYQSRKHGGLAPDDAVTRKWLTDHFDLEKLHQQFGNTKKPSFLEGATMTTGRYGGLSHRKKKSRSPACTGEPYAGVRYQPVRRVISPNDEWEGVDGVC